MVAATGVLATPFLGVGLIGVVALPSALTTIGTIGVVKNLSDAKKSKKQNKELREELNQANLDSKTKQKVVEALNWQLEEVKAELRAERKIS